MNTFLGICSLLLSGGLFAMGDQWSESLAGVLLFILAVFLFQGGSLSVLVSQ